MGLFSTPRKASNASADESRNPVGSSLRINLRAVFTGRQPSVTAPSRRNSVGGWSMKKSKSLTVMVDPQPTKSQINGPCRFVATSTKLGSGAYGAVLLGQDLVTQAPVAIKFIPDGRMRTSSLEREVALLQRLSDADHPALVKFHGHVRPADVKAGEVQAEGTLPLPKPHTTCHALVMEPVRGGEMFDYVVKMEGLKEAESAPLMGQLCDAVQAAHSLGIAHRDLKLENVLLVRKRNAPAGPGQEGSSSIKLIDWGLAHQHTLGPDGLFVPEMLHSRCGSRSYMAPEVSNRDISSTVGYDGYAADVWSLGVCLFAMHLAFFPFEQANPEHDWRARRVIEAQRAGRSTMATILSFYPQKQINGGLSESLLALLDRMLVFNPRKRASLTEVLCSEWLAPHVPSCGFHATTAKPLALAHVSTRHSRSISSGSAFSDGSITPRSVAGDNEPPLYATGTRGVRDSDSSRRHSDIRIERVDSRSSSTTACTQSTISSVASSRASAHGHGAAAYSACGLPADVAASVAQAVKRMGPPPSSPPPDFVVAGASSHRGHAYPGRAARTGGSGLSIPVGDSPRSERDSPPPKHGRHSSSDADALEIATMLSKACKLSGLGSPRKPDRTGESSLIL